ncbi:MAG: hypothetical protein KDA60_22070, partial [Planctomycetales bacterium]|nr:hypothetical protein [Planctomycetales bacterium]
RPTTLIQSLLGSSESATTEVDEIQYVDLHPNGRWVMVTTESGKVRVFHRDSREELACATELRARVARFRADGQAILLGNRGSLHIVPCHDDGESLSVEVGERRALLDEFKAAPGCGECAWSDDGQRIIFNSTSGQAILLTLSGEVIKKVVVPTAGRLNRVAIDSLGRWAAAGPFQGVETRVYAVADGELLASFETWRALVDFSPCGRWLGINGNAEILIVDTQDWKVRHRIDKPETHWGPLAFDPTGQLLFATLSERDLAVIDVQSGQRVGSINSPEAGRIKSLLYSHEHNVLLVGRDHVEAWDMRRIRDTLAAMGLDW